MKNTLKLIVMALAVVLCVVLPPETEAKAAEIIDSGTCGDNLTWTLDDEGTLTISGTGEMHNYDYNASPWFGNSSIKTIIMGNEVTSIGSQAFRECSGLTDVLTIPDSVTSIGSCAFCDCRGLTSVEIGSGVASIGYWAFTDCSSLMSFAVSLDNLNYCSDSGVLFNKDKTELIQYPASKISTDYVIPESVTSIGNNAFWYCRGLINAPEITEKITSIGDRAFWYCSMDGVITIPYSVNSIGKNAFYYCPYITSIEVSPSNMNYSSYDGVLFNKDKTELIQYPAGKTDNEYVIPNGVTVIGSCAFFGCSRLTGTMVMPDSVTSIEDTAFCYCSGLTGMIMSKNIMSIGYGAFKSTAFYGNEANWEDGVLYIGNSLIKANSLSGEYKVKSETTVIADNSFENCTDLTSIEIGSNVINIGNNAFIGCSSITDVYYDGTRAMWNRITIGDNNAPLLNANIHYIGESVYEIEAFFSSASYDGSAVTATLDFDLCKRDAEVFVAVFQDEQFAAIGTATVTKGTETATISVPVSELTGKCHVKAFFLDAESFAPLGESLETIPMPGVHEINNALMAMNPDVSQEAGAKDGTLWHLEWRNKDITADLNAVMEGYNSVFSSVSQMTFPNASVAVNNEETRVEIANGPAFIHYEIEKITNGSMESTSYYISKS